MKHRKRKEQENWWRKWSAADMCEMTHWIDFHDRPGQFLRALRSGGIHLDEYSYFLEHKKVQRDARNFRRAKANKNYGSSK